MSDYDDARPGAKRRTGWFVFFCVVGTLAFVFAMSAAITSAYNSTMIRQDQERNSQVVTSTNDIAKQLDDCILPTGECYQRSQENTAAAVADIGLASFFAAACAADEKVVQEPSLQRRAAMIERCALELLERRGPTGAQPPG